MKELIDRYANMGYKLVVDETHLTACSIRNNSKARIPRPLFNYQFRSVQRLNDFCKEWIDDVQKTIDAKANKKQLLAEASKGEHPFKEGMILYNSWGWDQTNIDFYQVVEVKPKSIKIRPINSAYAKDQKGCRDMCAYVVPVKDAFKGEPETKRVMLRLQSINKTPTFYITSKYGSFNVYDQGDAGLYSSWYA